MIQVPAQASVFVMHESVNFRKGIDGMAAVARVVLEQEPMSGAFFVFRNKGRHMLRILFYDGGGFWLCVVLVLMFLSSRGYRQGRSWRAIRCDGRHISERHSPATVGR